MMRTERCACGGSISVVQPALPATVQAAVEEHAYSGTHQEWIRLGRWDYSPELQGRVPLAIMGPASCKACRGRVWWTGHAWVDQAGRHTCRAA